MNKDYKSFSILVKNNKEKVAALEFLGQLTGLPVCKSTLAQAKGDVDFLEFKYIRADKDVDAYKNEQGETFRFEDVYRILLLPDFIAVKLNDEYEAKVSADGVIVGCQKFSLASIDSLYQAVEKVRKIVK